MVLQAFIDNPHMVIYSMIAAALCSAIFIPHKKGSSSPSRAKRTDKEDTFLTYEPYEPKATWASDWQVLKAMWFAKITGSDLQERLDSFYETQADMYDSYRFRMLHGRPLMMQAIADAVVPTNAAQKKSGIVWVDLACGTGSNAENFATGIRKGKFSGIYLVDLCRPLCRVAQRERADKYNTKKEIVRVLHGDATDPRLDGLPAAGTVDLVTISYSLVMIPDWPKALEQAKRLLRPKTGILAVCDFTIVPDQQSPLSRYFWTETFRRDHVHLNADHLPTLQANFDEIESDYGFGTLPYTPPFLEAAYYYFVGRNK